MAVGVRTDAAQAPALLAPAYADSRRMGALLVAARRIANSVIAGSHGYHRHGAGENFWQFRPYTGGESTARIDWRRSARDNHIYIRDREQQAAQTIYLCPDLSASMRYQSGSAQHAKDERALLLTLALADIFCRTGERIAIPGLTPVIHARNGAERAALALLQAAEKNPWLEMAQIGRYADAVIISDFLLPDKEIDAIIHTLSQRQVRAHVIEVADPAEAQFPFDGRIIFQDPEDGDRLTAGNAQSYRKAYKHLYQAQRKRLADLCRRRQWQFSLSMTDRPLSETLNSILTALETGGGNRRGIR